MPGLSDEVERITIRWSAAIEEAARLVALSRDPGDREMLTGLDEWIAALDNEVSRRLMMARTLDDAVAPR